MKDNSNVMQKMLWKDAKTIWPLLQAILCGMIVFNLLGLLWLTFTAERNPFLLYQAFWILMPNLLALGAPALLIGSEEESGTLAWLRTLPVKWQQIVDSKFLVSAVALLIAWIVSTIIVCAICFGPGRVNESTPAFTDSLLAVGGFGQLFFMSFVLLLVGFIAAYLFRSPIAALIALVPMMIAIYGLMFWVEGWYELQSTRPHWSVVIAAALAWLALLWIVQRLLGRRRLTSAGRRRKPVSESKKLPKFAYRPPTGVGMQTPSPTRALLWQQARQVGPAVAVMAGASALFLLAAMSRPRSGPLDAIQFFAPLIVGTSAMWIGAIAFYGDSVRRRCAYFADRGISPTQVWWTRLSIPGLACLLITIMAFFADLTPNRHSSGFPWYVVLILFGFGQLVSQWVSRPILSFFAAPVYVGVCCFYYFVFFDRYEDYAWTTCLLVPVLLFATWRLSRRWLDGRIDNGFHWRAIAYTTLAIAIPLCVTLAHRIASTPRLDVAWRQKAMAATDNMQWQGPNTYLSPFYNPWDSPVQQYMFAEGHDVFAKEIQQELENESEDIWQYVSTRQLRSILNTRFTHDVDPAMLERIRYRSVEVMLKWSAMMRQQAASGRLGMHRLQRITEPMEREAVEILRTRPHILGSQKQIARLVDMIPGKELRHQSRERSMLIDWRRYQNPGREPRFLGVRYPRGKGLAHIEKRRSDRFLDKLVKELWQDLESGLPDVSYAITHNGERVSFVEGRQASYYHFQSNDLKQDPRIIGIRFNTWTTEYEISIDELREKYSSTNTNTNAEKLEASTD